MKKGKNVKLKGYDSYKINYGTVDSKNLKSLYLNLQTWVEPKEFINSPTRIINNLSRTIKHSILDILDSNIFEDKFIVDLDLRSSGIQVGKKSFMNLECYFYIKETNINFKSECIKTNIKKICNHIIESNFSNNKNFQFSMSKKQYA
jgi:hypothetical protein